MSRCDSRPRCLHLPVWNLISATPSPLIMVECAAIGRRALGTAISVKASQSHHLRSLPSIWKLRVNRVLCGSLVLVAALEGVICKAGTPEASAGTIPLNTVASVRQLTLKQGKQGLPVRLRGIVTHAGLNGFYLDDGTYAIYVAHPEGSSPVKKRDVVEVGGKTCTGAFAPADVLLEQVKVLGQGTLPAPKPVSFAELDSAAVDCRLVQVQGVVRGQHNYHSQPGGALKLLVERFPIEVGVQAAAGEGVDFGIGARVRVVGIACGRFNKARQLVSPRLAASKEDIHILESPPPDLFDRPIVSTMDFFRFGQRSDPETMVKVEGVVLAQRGEGLFLRDDAGSLRISAAQVPPLSSGTRVEAVGFAGRLGPVSILEDALVRRVGEGKTVLPRRTSAQEIMEGHLDAELVTVDATVRGSTVRAKDWTLLCQQGADFFKASWRREDQVGETAQARASGPVGRGPWQIGSRLRLTGVVVLEGEVASGAYSAAREFELLIRSPQEITLLAAPPWWDARKLAGLSGVLALVAIAVTLWVWELRREVRRRGMALASVLAREAQQEERQRIGRELHDTFAQGLTGLGYELMAMAREEQHPAKRKQHLDRAFDLLRRTREETRRGILNIRAAEVETKDLPTFLSDSLALLFQDAPVELEFSTSGTVRLLSAAVQSNLVRIAQEAAANTLRHAQASKLRLQLAFEDKGVRLVIADNGGGFDVATAQGKPGRFGLCSMRERAQQIGAVIKIESDAQTGTRVCLWIPADETNQASGARNRILEYEKSGGILPR